MKDISIEDLLAREVADIDVEKVSLLVKDKVVMVTGAGGSIGSEIIRQLLKFEPKRIVAYEIDETELHGLGLELDNPVLETVVGDVRDLEKLDRIMDRYKPSVVFHAAAYKHVPMMEYFPEEAVKTNIAGTRNLVECSIKYGVDKLVNISTDKAVNPTSIMGATKRVSEMICRSYNKESKTKFVSVRFGNVLGSRGSAVPIFIEQIKKGGPVTVTHPDMKRYFMSIPEAVLLVFQAAAMGEGGEVFVLDMGEPIKIVELVERLIKLEGLKPYRDIDIKFTGIRPGEKLFEELLTAEEGTLKTKHSKIYIANMPNPLDVSQINEYVKELSYTANSSISKIKSKLQQMIPFYKESE